MTRHMVTINQAAEITGLSRRELRTGVLSGKYPAMRVGGEHGKFLLDIDLLNGRITELMKENCNRQEPDSGHIRRIPE